MGRIAMSVLSCIIFAAAPAEADTDDGSDGNGDGVDCVEVACGGGGTFDFDGVKLELDLGKTWKGRAVGFFLGGRLHVWVNGDDAWRLASLMGGAHVELVPDVLHVRPFAGVADIWTTGGHEPMLLAGAASALSLRDGGLGARLESSHYLGASGEYAHIGRLSADVRFLRIPTGEKTGGGEPIRWDVRAGPHAELRGRGAYLGAQVSWIRTGLPFRIEAAYDFGLQEEVRGHSLRFTLAVDAF
jgi:hypothetical protein